MKYLKIEDQFGPQLRAIPEGAKGKTAEEMGIDASKAIVTNKRPHEREVLDEATGQWKVDAALQEAARAARSIGGMTVAELTALIDQRIEAAIAGGKLGGFRARLNRWHGWRSSPAPYCGPKPTRSLNDMQTFAGIADARDAAQDYFFANRASFPDHVQDVLRDQFRTGASPVDAIVNFVEIVFANRQALPAAALSLAAGIVLTATDLGLPRSCGRARPRAPGRAPAR